MPLFHLINHFNFENSSETPLQARRNTRLAYCGHTFNKALGHFFFLRALF